MPPSSRRSRMTVTWPIWKSNPFMPKLKRLSGDEVIAIFARFGFTICEKFQIMLPLVMIRNWCRPGDLDRPLVYTAGYLPLYSFLLHTHGSYNTVYPRERGLSWDARILFSMINLWMLAARQLASRLAEHCSTLPFERYFDM